MSVTKRTAPIPPPPPGVELAEPIPTQPIPTEPVAADAGAIAEPIPAEPADFDEMPTIPHAPGRIPATRSGHTARAVHPANGPGKRPGSDLAVEPSQQAVTVTMGNDVGVTLRSARPVRGGHGVGQTQPVPPTPKTMAVHAGIKRYDISHEIGRGGMGAIMCARDRDLRREVAMKVLLNPNVPLDDDQTKSRVSRFLEEAQITGQLEHPNIVPVHDIGLDARGQWYFTMKLVQGEALSEILHKLKQQAPGEEPYRGFTRHRLLEVFNKICDAVAYAHSRGVIHRDLKPANVMVGAFGEVLVMDWGIAKILDLGKRETTRHIADTARTGRGRTSGIRGASGRQATLAETTAGDLTDSDSNIAEIDSLRADGGIARTMDGQVVGTPAYMAPEQAKGEIEQISERTDVYALGAMLYEILTFQPPFTGSTALEILAKVAKDLPPSPDHVPGKSEVPAELSAIVMHALQKSPKRRYASVKLLRDDLDRFADGRPISVYRASVWQRSAKWMKRNKIQTAMIAAALLIAGTVSVASWLTLSAQDAQLQAEEFQRQAEKHAQIEAEQRETMAWALSELERIRLQIRSSVEYQSSRDDLLEVRRRAPNFYPAIFELARIYDKLAETQNATGELEALRDDANAPADFRAQAAIELGVRVLNTAVLSHPDSVQDLRAAEPHFRRAAELATPNTPFAAAAMAMHAASVAATTGSLADWNRADELSIQAIDTFRTMWEPWYARARVYAMPLAPEFDLDESLADPAQVVLASSMALNSEPQLMSARRLRSRFRLDAAEAVDMANLVPAPATKIVAAHALRLDGQRERALELSREIVVEWPENGWGWLERAECAREMRAVNEALAAAEKAVSLLPKNADAYRVRANIRLELKGDAAGALQDLQETLRLDSQDVAAIGIKASVMTAVGTVQNRTDYLTSAAEAFKNYLELRPGSVVARDARARVLLAIGQYREAFIEWNRAIELDRHRFQTWSTLYRVLAQIHRYDDALRCLSAGLACAPHDLLDALQADYAAIQQARTDFQVQQRMGYQYRATLADYMDVGKNLLAETRGLSFSMRTELAYTRIELDRAKLTSIESDIQALVASANAVPATVEKAASHDRIFGASSAWGRQNLAHNRGMGQIENPNQSNDPHNGNFTPHNGNMPQPPNARPNSETQQNPKPQHDPTSDDDESFDESAPLDQAFEHLRRAAREDDKRRNPRTPDAAPTEPSESVNDRERGSGAEYRGFSQTVRRNDKSALLTALPLLLAGLPPALSGTDHQTALKKFESAQEAITATQMALQRAPQANPNTLLLLGATYVHRANTLVVLGELAKAAQDMDTVAQFGALEPEFAYFAAVLYLRLAEVSERDAEMPTPEACRERALQYLELAVMKGLPERAEKLAASVFAPLSANPRFQRLR